MRALLVSAVAAAIGVLLLKIFYRAIKTEWPENYVSVSGDFGVVVNRTLLKYAAFRLVPVYAVTLLVSETAGRFGGRPLYVALTVGIVHVVFTNVRHMMSVLRRRPRSHTRTATIFVHIVTSTTVLLAVFLGGLGVGPLTAVVPPLDEFFKSFWTTAIIAMLGVYVAGLSRATRSASTLARRSSAELGKLVDRAREEARATGVQEDLVEAVLLTENLERPGWVRSFERMKGRISPAGTYGVMQVYSMRPVDDEESIKRGIAKLREVPLRSNRWGPEPESIQEVLRHYNNDNNFVDLARSIYYEICRPADTSTSAIAGDQRAREEKIKERIDLTVTVAREMATRMESSDGIMTLARANIDDLRALAEIVNRLPSVESPEARGLRVKLEHGLSDERAATDGAQPDAIN